MFSENVAISYPDFKFDFTIWMLGHVHHYLAELVMITFHYYGLSSPAGSCISRAAPVSTARLYHATESPRTVSKIQDLDVLGVVHI